MIVYFLTSLSALDIFTLSDISLFKFAFFKLLISHLYFPFINFLFIIFPYFVNSIVFYWFLVVFYIYIYIYIYIFVCTCMHAQYLIMSYSLQLYGLCSPTGSFVHGIFPARILEWLAISFSRSSWPRDWTCISCAPLLTGRLSTTEPYIWESLYMKVRKMFYIHIYIR